VIISIIAIVMIVSACTLIANATGMLQSGPIYSVAVVTSGVQHNPQHWIGKRLLLQGSVGSRVCNQSEKLFNV
jgi:hypothetical protein